jgi:hypothetical protein
MTPSHVGEDRKWPASTLRCRRPISKRPSGRSLGSAEHRQNATPLQRAVDRITALLGRPRFIGVLTALAAGGISLNVLAAALGYRPIDPPPFSGLGGAVSLVSFYLVGDLGAVAPFEVVRGRGIEACGKMGLGAAALENRPLSGAMATRRRILLIVVCRFGSIGG